MKSTFHKDICVAKVNLGDVTSLEWNMLRLCLTRVKCICVSGKHKLQVVRVPNGKVCFKWTAWRFGNWILPSSIPRQICKAIARWQDCSISVPLVAHIMGLCVRDTEQMERSFVFPQEVSICIPVWSVSSQVHFLLSHWKQCLQNWFEWRIKQDCLKVFTEVFLKQSVCFNAAASLCLGAGKGIILCVEDHSALCVWSVITDHRHS